MHLEVATRGAAGVGETDLGRAGRPGQDKLVAGGSVGSLSLRFPLHSGDDEPTYAWRGCE